VWERVAEQPHLRGSDSGPKGYSLRSTCAGTTGAALRAGVPSVMVPFSFDQPFWGARVHALGAATRPVPHRRLSASRLAHAIRQAMSPQVKERARMVGEMIRAEGGVARAVEIIETVAA